MYVVDSRESRDPPGIRRRRTCAYCHKRVTTYEITQEKWSQMQRAYKDNITKKFEMEMKKEEKSNNDWYIWNQEKFCN